MCKVSALNPKGMQKRFLAQSATWPPSTSSSICCCHDVGFFMKDSQGRFMLNICAPASSATRTTNCKTLGKTTTDFFSREPRRLLCQRRPGRDDERRPVVNQIARAAPENSPTD
jgi:hypothetical protein